jgi:hypothetical protein
MPFRSAAMNSLAGLDENFPSCLLRPKAFSITDGPQGVLEHVIALALEEDTIHVSLQRTEFPTRRFARFFQVNRHFYNAASRVLLSNLTLSGANLRESSSWPWVARLAGCPEGRIKRLELP